MDDVVDKNNIVVFNGGATSIHRGIFMSSSPSFASDYGSLRAFELSLDGVFDALNPEHVVHILPLFDPYDGTYIDTLDAYFERSSDTWEMIEDVVKGYPVIKMSEGGVTNYLVNDTNQLAEIDLQVALNLVDKQPGESASYFLSAGQR